MAAGCDGLAILKMAAAHMSRNSLVRKRIQNVIAREVQAGVHLGIFVEPFLEAILDGRKTVESRFAIRRCPPFDRVRAGDVIFLKRSGGPIVGIAVAGEARYFELDHKTLRDIRRRYAARICAEDDAFWDARSEKRFATLIEIEEVEGIPMLQIDKRDRRGWVTYASAA